MYFGSFSLVAFVVASFCKSGDAVPKSSVAARSELSSPNAPHGGLQGVDATSRPRAESSVQRESDPLSR